MTTPPPPPASTSAPSTFETTSSTVVDDALAPGPRRRPRAIIGSVVTLAGAVTAAVGAFSTWFSIDGIDVDGFSQLVDDDGASTGAVVMALAVVLAGVAVITLLGRRVVPIAIAGAGVGVATIVFGAMRRADLRDAADRYAGVIELGPGSDVVIAGGVVATFGSLVVLLVRRRR